MPVTRSAKKALRVSRRRHEENLRVKKALKDALKRASKERLNDTYSAIDKAVKFDIIHTNKAARLKSRLVARFGRPVSPSPKKRKPKPVKKLKRR